MGASAAGDLFDRLARRYDRGNRIISLGQDLRWKRRAVKRLHVPPDATLLDLGAGTGDLSRIAKEAFPTASVVAIDASRAMLRAGRFPPGAAVVGDAQQLPLRDASADGAVSGFLLRNLPDLDAFFAAAARALRPGARLVVLEIAYPKGTVQRALFRAYFHGVAPLLGGVAAGNFAAYRYLSRSLRAFPPPERLAEMAQAAGFSCVAIERSAWLGLFLLVLRRDASVGSA